MRWLNRLPGSVRSASGLEWKLWRKLPLLLLAGTLLPLAVLVLLHWLSEQGRGLDPHRLQIVDYAVAGVVSFHWLAVITVGLGCVIVMLMKGPAYVADGMPVSHSERPRPGVPADHDSDPHPAAGSPPQG